MGPTVCKRCCSSFSPLRSFISTLWLFNIAMENGPFIDDFPMNTSIYKGFSMAMLNNQMVSLNITVMYWSQAIFQQLPMAPCCRCHRLRLGCCGGGLLTWPGQHGTWVFLRTQMLRTAIPSGKHTKNYGKSPYLMGKSTINHHFQ